MSGHRASIKKNFRRTPLALSKPRNQGAVSALANDTAKSTSM